MSKAISILVLDYTPDYCEECPCYNEEWIQCKALDNHTVPLDRRFSSPRPDWCPLKEAPEYKPIWYDDEQSNWERGYNACLDTILGIEEDI